MGFFESVLIYLDVLLKVCVSISTTQTGFTYSVSYSVPTDIGLYFSSRLVEVRNFSSVFTGISKRIEMNTTFQETSSSSAGAPHKQLYIINATRSLLNSSSSTFVNYQRDFYNFMVSKNNSMFSSCSNYFDDCSSLSQTSFTSKISATDETTQQFFIINQMLKQQVSHPGPSQSDPSPVLTSLDPSPSLQTHRILPSSPFPPSPHQTPTDPLSLSFSTSGLVQVSHFSLSSSFFYLLVGLGFVHSVVLVYGIVDLRRNPSLTVYKGHTGHKHHGDPGKTVQGGGRGRDETVTN